MSCLFPFCGSSVNSQVIVHGSLSNDSRERKVSSNRKVENVISATTDLHKKTNRTIVIKEHLGLNVRVKVLDKEQLFSASINIDKLAKKYGIATKNGKKFLKNILRCSRFSLDVFLQIKKAQEENILEKMVNHSTLLGNPEYLLEEDSFNRSKAACRQGVDINNDTIFGGREKLLLTLDKTREIAIKVLNSIGEGSYSSVNLAWIPESKQFVAIKTTKNELTENSYSLSERSSKMIEDTNRLSEFYDHLKKNTTSKELDLIEKPDLLVKEEGQVQAFAIRDLASIGNLLSKGK
jgi:hypothetical protein